MGGPQSRKRDIRRNQGWFIVDYSKYSAGTKAVCATILIKVEITIPRVVNKNIIGTKSR